MRNTSNYQNLNGLNVMNINIETNITAIDLNHNRNDCQPNGLPVATKSQPKSKTKCLESCSRPTKRPPSERRFKCDQCERMFFTRKDVKRHLVVHTGIRNFACPYCTQRFGRKDHLVRHAKKSHNRDTRSSTTLKNNSSAHTSSKANAMPTLIEPKNGPNGPVQELDQHIGHNTHKQNFNYNSSQTDEHLSLVSLANTNSSHNNNVNTDNHCSPYGNHSNPNPNNLTIGGMHGNESVCQYMPGVHAFDEMLVSNTIKSETPPLGAHYFTFPVNSTALTYPLPNPSFLSNCFVTNTTGNMSSCGNTAQAVAAFGIPVSNVSNVSNPIHTTFSVDVNPSLPHFSQAFQ